MSLTTLVDVITLFKTKSTYPSTKLLKNVKWSLLFVDPNEITITGWFSIEIRLNAANFN